MLLLCNGPRGHSHSHTCNVHEVTAAFVLVSDRSTRFDLKNNSHAPVC